MGNPSSKTARLAAAWALAGFVAPAMAYHPFLTEDTEALGAGRHQVEITFDATRDRSGAASLRSEQASLVYGYGLAKTLDIKLGVPHLRLRTDDGSGARTGARGCGDASIELKWQILEKEGFTLGLKPGVTLASGDANRRLGQGRSNVGVVLMAGYEAGGWEFYGHLGARNNRNTIGERRSLYQASALTLWEAAERLWLGAEAGVLRQPDPARRRNPSFLGLAVIWGPTKDVDLDIGWRRALNGAAPDRVLSAGLTVRW